jgi:hypothetical protein
MLFKLIACNVFQREACIAIAGSPHVVDVEFTELGEHARSDRLRGLLQQRIDAAEASGKAYDAILLLFGVCGNATVGLTARRTRIILPRAHDCCTILLGSRKQFEANFKDAPSTPFSSVGYMERGSYFLRTSDDGDAAVILGDQFRQLVEQYGEEDARYIWEQMHPALPGDDKAVFIDIPETAHLGHKQQFEAKAAAAGKRTVHLSGDLRLIRALLSGDWSEEEFLTVRPGETIAGVYDFDRIVTARKA